jgi:hypothetical protein
LPRPTHYSIPCTGVKTGRLRAWSLNNYQKTIFLFEKYARCHCMCKELPVISVNRVVDKKRIIGKMGAEEE